MGYLTASQATDYAVAALEKARREAEYSGGFAGRVPTLVTDNGTCFLSRRFHDYASEHFNHVRIQYRTPTQLGLLGAVSWNLERRRIVLEPVRQSGRYASLAGRVPGALQPDALALGSFKRRRSSVLPVNVYLDGRGVEFEVAGMASAAKKKLPKMTGKLPIFDFPHN